MFLKLNHQSLDVFNASKEFVLECYRISKMFPDSEKFTMIAQIRRAALSVHLNIAEGCSRKSETERKRFYEVARGSIIEIDAAFDIAEALDYIKKTEASVLGKKMVLCFKLLSGMIN